MASAQQVGFIEHLRTKQGAGVVIVHQDRTLNDLVCPVNAVGKREDVKLGNVEKRKEDGQSWQKKPQKANNQSKENDSTKRISLNDSGKANNKTYVVRRRHKANGFRIQVFTGGNSRADRLRAERMQSLVKKHFPELSVYIHFLSPRWVCRVGDFKTRESAARYVAKIRKVKGFQESRIVNTTVLLPY